ncbi:MULTISPECIES: NADH-quinone oxidoreductase subunit C [Tessaracoccus]|uniref:NADH-quinone oxidoreductase subunit C n=2 Tax=Tessaracoccus TaxID=72763 RepID=A0ABY8Q028_9ACTN|nr:MULTISPECIES: NADH-quinone oxidoreductase subunit C [Tessaracoccus]QXT62209.1 NADH-quinone oxidoreductase subunit C [Tessaracoccus palaemonis]WGT47851.1 NADH-quinone oxidoreductase subunit C [Tessaracoccus sp. T21]
MSWVERVESARADGHTFLLDLTAVDEVGSSDEIRVIARLLDPVGGGIVTLDEAVDRGDARLPSIAHLLPAAGWLQRQVHDLFGVTFDGADNRPLIYHGDVAAPLRKDVLLEQRQTTSWPGGLEPGERGSSPSRRKLVPPGVPDPAVLAAPDSTAADIAVSATGARVRRSR